MQRVKSQSIKVSFETFLLIWAIAFGALVRFAPVIGSSFPINDGGLFYVMVQDLINAHYSLPFYITYNMAHIPFGYPPLPFYITALLSQGLGIPLLQLVHWLPAFITTLTIPTFYLLSRTVLKSRLKAALATVAFAMVPRAFDLFIQGGGLTRSFGALFSILTLYNVYLLFNRRQKKYILYTILFAGLLVWSHPETTFHTVFIAALLWLFLGRDRQSILYASLVAFGVILVTAPWWWTVILRHGFSPFQSIMQSDWHHLLFWTPFLTLNFANERFLGIITLLGVLGLIANLTKKEYLLVAWLVTPFFIEPRNPYFSAIIPLTMLMSIGFDDIVYPGLRALETGGRNLTPFEDIPRGEKYLQSTGGKIILTFFLVYTLINAYAFSVQMARLTVNKEENAAMQWIIDNTPEASRFLLLTYGNPFNTPIQEWFPALTGRISLTTVQGYEWLPGRQFYQRRDKFELLKRCLLEDVKCVEDWSAEQGYTFDYIYVYQGIVGEISSDDTATILGRLLIQSMVSSPCYNLVYESARIKVFSRDSTSSCKIP